MSIRSQVFKRTFLIFIAGLILIEISRFIYSRFFSIFLLPLYITIALLIAYGMPLWFRLIYKTKKYHGKYREQLFEFAKKQKVLLGEIYVKKGGAYDGVATGFLNNKSVVFSNQLMDSHPYDQIEAVFAHELGHHATYYVSIHAVLLALILYLAGWLNTLLVSYYPYPLPVLFVISLASLLLVLFVSRRGEQQADNFAKLRLADPGAFGRFLKGSVLESEKRGFMVPKNPWIKFYTPILGFMTELVCSIVRGEGCF